MLFGKGLQPMRPKEVRVVEVAQGVSLGYVAMDPDGVVEFSGTRFGVPEPRQKRPARLFSTLPAEVSPLTRPRMLLRLEGAAILLLAALAYGQIPGNWLLFVVLLLAPDAGMLGYLRGTALGAATYNLFHNYALPAVLVAFAIVMVEATPLALGLIWAAHIGMDRMIGFGLKYPTGFRHTHLDRL